MKILLIFLLATAILSLNLKLGETTPNASYENLIINGNFKFPPLIADVYGYFTEVKGWDVTDPASGKANDIEIGFGKLYNPNWKDNDIIVELDGKNNDQIKQTVNVKADKTCVFKFSYAASYRRRKSSELRVSFGDQMLLTKDLSDDYIIHNSEITVELKSGDNVFKFEAFNPEFSDGNGMNITNIELWCLKDEVTIQSDCDI